MADYYSDDGGGPPASSQSAPPETAPQGDPAENENSNAPTAVLDKSILMGKDFKPGDEVVLKIVSMQGDEVVVEYAPEPEPDREPAPAAPGGDSGMSAMME